MNKKGSLEDLISEIRECRICEEFLPLGPRPVLEASESAKIMIVGQAPGTKVHETGIPWNDPSGVKLREWLQMDRDTFYDSEKIAIIPMGFCYPGRGKSGDLPPRPECAPQWHEKLFRKLPNLQLILLAGTFAINYYLKEGKFKTLSATIRNHRFEDKYIPLVHPSPRNRLWLRRNSWFEDSYIPKVRKIVWKVLD